MYLNLGNHAFVLNLSKSMLVCYLFCFLLEFLHAVDLVVEDLLKGVCVAITQVVQELEHYLLLFNAYFCVFEHFLELIEFLLVFLFIEGAVVDNFQNTILVFFHSG